MLRFTAGQINKLPYGRPVNMPHAANQTRLFNCAHGDIRLRLPASTKNHSLFTISLDYKVPLSKVEAHIDSHKLFLQKYYDDGCFIASGRKVPRTGGVILAHAPNIPTIIENDPFYQHDIANYKIYETALDKDSLNNDLDSSYLFGLDTSLTQMNFINPEIRLFVINLFSQLQLTPENYSSIKSRSNSSNIFTAMRQQCITHGLSDRGNLISIFAYGTDKRTIENIVKNDPLVSNGTLYHIIMEFVPTMYNTKFLAINP